MSERLHPGVHPDPDALNAFVEGVLPEYERVRCLGHLAECSQCREVVFLAQKAAEMEEPVAVAEATPSLASVSFWRRLLRPKVVVSAVAAAIAVVFSFGLYRMMRSPEPPRQMIATVNAPVETAPAPTAKAEHPAPAAQAEQSAPQIRPTAKKASPPSVAKEQEQPPAAAQPLADLVSPPPPPPAAVAVAAQLAGEGGLIGTIVDPAGAVVAGARVELKSADTGSTYASTSNPGGQYSIAELPAGRYDLSVTVPGFKKYVRPGVNVQPRQVARLDSTLSVGAASESVTVTSEAALLKTETGELSNNAGVTSLNDLPVLAADRGNAKAAMSANPVYTLPDKSIPVSAAQKDKLVVAVDAAGALFVSENAGKNWTRVKAAWKGKAVHVAVNASAMFELTTEPASTWVSTDGRRWSEARASR